MGAITIDGKLYDNAMAYAKRHRTSLTNLVENYIMQLVSEENNTAAKQESYYISPAVKALESKFRPDGKLSADYKKEIAEHRDRKYL